MIPTLREVVSIGPQSPFNVRAAKRRQATKRSAKKRGLDFNLTKVDIARLLLSEKCHYTGISFKKEGPCMMTLDRVDNGKGYIKGNVVPCCGFVNHIKNLTLEGGVMKGMTLTLEQLTQMVHTLNTGEQRDYT